MTPSIDRTRRALLGAMGVYATAPLWATERTSETWPNRPVRFVVPYAAGNQADLVARALAEELGKKFGQSFYVENAPGAGGALGVGQVARAKPDGYTIGIAAIAALAVVPQMQKLQYDPFVDLKILSAVSELRVMALAVGPSVTATNLQELSTLIKARAGRPLTFSSAGTGTIPHLSMEMISAAMQGNFVHIPYKGASSGVTDVIGGQVDMAFEGLSVLKGHADAGRLRILATNEPVPGSGVATFAQQGVQVSLKTAWQSLIAPAQVPVEWVARLERAVAEILAQPEMRARYPIGTDVLSLSGAAALARVKEDHGAFGRIVRQLAGAAK